jgi:DNA-binding transcriptional LysR family regulator
MDAADLRMFQSVASTGSMSKAALELNTVQSNVTARIKSLEDEVGFALFVASLIAAGALIAAAAPAIRTSWVVAANAGAENAIPAFTAPRTALDRDGRTARH